MYHPNIGQSLHQAQSNFSETNPPPIFICYDVKNKLPISLESVNYVVNVQPGLAVVEIQQIYNTQHYEVPIELEYMFIIQKDSAVSKMVAELGDLKVLGIVKELEEAKQEYEKGIQDGKTMIISQQDKKITELKKVKVGCLAPGKSLKITFEYIQPLKVYLNQFWKLELSPMVDSSYLTVYSLKNQSNNYPQLYQDIQKNVDLQSLQQKYRQNITIQIKLQKPITFVKSPTHQILINNDDHQFVKQNLTKSQVIILDDKFPDNFAPNKRFELLFSSDDINQPHSFLTHTNNDALQHIKYCATLSLIPKFNEVPLDDAYSSYINGLNLSTETKANRGNYFFLIDRSGSMGGKRIEKAKQSLILFLKSLPEDCLFNIISFGSKSKRMFENLQQYNQKSLNDAISEVNTMDADFGGTDIYEALKNGIYDDDSKTSKETYNAFLLTDGEDSPERILDLVQNQTKSNFRIYTLGIGDGCSQYLLKTIAEIGNGKFQFVTDYEDINVKVIDLLEDSITQYLEGFKLDLPDINISQIIPDPESITTLKKNEELVIQLLFPASDHQILDIQIKCFNPQEQKQISYTYQLKINESLQQDYFHKLAAHKLINYYESSIQNNIKQVNKFKVNQETFNNQDIINLSISNQILCSKTAYICEICYLEDEFKQLIKEKILYKHQQVQKIPINHRNMDFHSDDACEDEEYYEEEYCLNECIYGQYLQPLSDNEESVDIESKNNFIQQIPPSTDNNNIIQKQQEADVLISYLDLLYCIQSNGSFILEKKMSDSIKLFSLNNDNHYEDILWSTIIALFYLELHCQSDKASWQLIYQKAIFYLKKNGLDYFKIKTEHYNNYQKLFEVTN